MTLINNKSEMGQGVYTSLSMIVAEELDCDWQKVRVIAAPVDPVYDHTQFGSQVTRGKHQRPDRMAAPGPGRGYGPGHTGSGGGAKLAGRPGRLPYRERPSDPSRRPTSRLQQTGGESRGNDGSRPDRTQRSSALYPHRPSGTAVFGIDMQLPGMLVAVIAAQYGAITIKDGRVEQGNFDDYPLLHLDETPKIEVHIVPSSADPGGIGEPGVPPVAPAVANALFALSGARIRALPLTPDKVLAAMEKV